MSYISILRSEPVRMLLHPLILALVAYLVTKGILDSNTSQIVLAVVAAVLGIPAVEAARARVTPVKTP